MKKNDNGLTIKLNKGKVNVYCSTLPDISACEPATISLDSSNYYRRDVKHALFDNENTRVVSTINRFNNAYHHYAVQSMKDGTILSSIDFQEGPIKEVGVNGVSNEDLILMVVDRLKSFQESEYNCPENDVAIQHLYSAVKALKSRTERRISEGVEGTSNV